MIKTQAKKTEVRWKRSEFWEWMSNCPNKEWFTADSDEGFVRVFFPVEEDTEVEE